MIDPLFSFSEFELLYILTFVLALFAGINISLKQKVHPVLTMLLVLAGITAYLGVANIAREYIKGFDLDYVQFQNVVVLLGVLGSLLAIRLLKSLFSIPSMIIHNQLLWIYILFTIYQLQVYLGNNLEFSFLIYSFPISDIAGVVHLGSFKQSASLIPDLFSNSLLFYESVTAILAMLIYLYFRPRFRRPGSAYALTLLLFMVLLFISLFGINQAGYPVLSDRLLGLNLIQWGLVLLCTLVMAQLMAAHIDARHHKKEVLKKAPPEYRLLITYLILTLISFQITTVYDPYAMKIFVLGFFVTSFFMIFYFLNTAQKNYLKYGTASIILVVCMLFLYSSYSESRNIRDAFSGTAIGPDLYESTSHIDP